MEEYIYAQLNDNNFCVCVSYLNGEIDAPNVIRLVDDSVDVLGAKYENGEFVFE